MIKQLRKKFIIVNMVIVSIMLVIIFGLIIFFTKSSMEKESIQLLRSVPMMHAQHDMPVHKERPDISPPSVFIIFRTFDNIYQASGSEVVNFSDNELISELYNIALSSDKQSGVLREYNLRYFIHDVPNHPSIAFKDISAENAMLSQLVKTCIFIALLSFCIFLIISILLARWTVKPAETAWNEQKQFIADASHELKTPLTVIMTNAEMLLDDKHTAEKRKQFSDSILTMSKQMRGLTENLLELARSDNNTKEISFEAVNFSNLISDALLPFEPLFYEKELVLTSEIQEDIIVSGDSTQLCRLADILLDNAMKYSYPNTSVTVSLKKHRDYCIFSVSNHGDTISKSDLKNIFKRFYRVDKARNMNCSYGLGLSIAESIVKEHEGKIWAESNNELNIFRIKLNLK